MRARLRWAFRWAFAQWRRGATGITTADLEETGAPLVLALLVVRDIQHAPAVLAKDGRFPARTAATLDRDASVSAMETWAAELLGKDTACVLAGEIPTADGVLRVIAAPLAAHASGPAGCEWLSLNDVAERHMSCSIEYRAAATALVRTGQLLPPEAARLTRGDAAANAGATPMRWLSA